MFVNAKCIHRYLHIIFDYDYNLIRIDCVNIIGRGLVYCEYIVLDPLPSYRLWEAQFSAYAEHSGSGR